MEIKLVTDAISATIGTIGDPKTAKDTMQTKLYSQETKQKIKIGADAKNLVEVQKTVIQASIEALVVTYSNDIEKLRKLNLQVNNLLNQPVALNISKKEQDILINIVTEAQEKAGVS